MLTHTCQQSQHVSEGKWREATVQVTAWGPCPVPGHALYAMHHFGNPDGIDYGPTGFLVCAACGGIADDPDVEMTRCPRCGSKDMDDVQPEGGGFRFRCHGCQHEWLAEAKADA